MKLSPYSHLIEVDESTYALWNSLWLRTVFLSGDSLAAVRELVQHGNIQLPVGLSQALEEQNFVSDPIRDEKKLLDVRQLMRCCSIGILYLVMTEGCNLACGYCFLRDMVGRKQATKKTMSFETARRAIDLFVQQVVTNQVGTPEIIFYGGEPLLSWSVFQQTLDYARGVLPQARFTINTNGVLITPEIARVLKEYNVEVALSLDGKNHDAYRVKLTGQGSLNDILQGLRILQGVGASVGISYTITDANVDLLQEDLRWMLDELGVETVDYNILMGPEIPVFEYATKAAAALLKCFKVARESGVYIDRVMRRVDAFSKGELNLYDCGGCGQQIVCAPDGRLGCCPAFLNRGEFFYPMEEVGNPQEHSLWQAWRQRSPLNIPECLRCEALGICGGGCFYTPYIETGNIMGLDQTHCELAKQTLRFLLRKLWQKAQK